MLGFKGSVLTKNEIEMTIAPWQINILPNLPIIETIFSGFLTKEELKLGMDETIAIAKSRTINRFLKDCTQLYGVQSIAVLFLLSGSLELRSVIFCSKKAFLLRDHSFAPEQVQHWETTCLKRGVEVRLFSDRQFALEWLAA